MKIFADINDDPRVKTEPLSDTDSIPELMPMITVEKTDYSKKRVKNLVQENTKLKKKNAKLEHKMKKMYPTSNLIAQHSEHNKCLSQQNDELKSKLEELENIQASLERQLDTYRSMFMCKNNCINMGHVRFSCGCIVCKDCRGQILRYEPCPVCGDSVIGCLDLQIEPDDGDLLSCVLSFSRRY